MKFHFFKYQATGNDFILIDNRLGNLSFSKEQIGKLCDRRFGVGAMKFIKVPAWDLDNYIVYGRFEIG